MQGNDIFSQSLIYMFCVISNQSKYMNYSQKAENIKFKLISPKIFARHSSNSSLDSMQSTLNGFIFLIYFLRLSQSDDRRIDQALLLVYKNFWDNH